MKFTTLIVLLAGTALVACTQNNKKKESTAHSAELPLASIDLPALLDSISLFEQTPIRLRDSLMDIYGAESEEAAVQHKIYKHNHAINEQKIRALLDSSGWPLKAIVGERGNRVICNVLQHAHNDVRIHYLPLMRQAVLDGQLTPQLLVRAEDRIATERGDLQIYGGQMKYYPETKSFNVWPVYDPVNIDKRRAEIGLGPIAEFLKLRFDFEWDLEEQIKRSEAFEAAKKK